MTVWLDFTAHPTLQNVRLVLLGDTVDLGLPIALAAFREHSARARLQPARAAQLEHLAVRLQKRVPVARLDQLARVTLQCARFVLPVRSAARDPRCATTVWGEVLAARTLPRALRAQQESTALELHRLV